MVDLPSYLSALIANMPQDHCYTIDRLIYQHTLLPFYAPFYPSERIEMVEKIMSDNTISLREIARRLEVDPRTVKFHVTRLQLPMKNINQFPEKNDHQQGNLTNNLIFDEQTAKNHFQYQGLIGISAIASYSYFVH